MPDQLLTTAQAAERLGVTARWVQKLIRDELLPAERFGRDYVIREADLAALVRRPVGRPRKERVND